MSDDRLGRLCAAGEPFFFITDFEGRRIECYTPDELAAADIECTFVGKGESHDCLLEPSPVAYDIYRQKLAAVQEYIRRGETYLLNLTQPTPVRSDSALRSIYRKANAPFKLRYKDDFVCFSPEKFIEIVNGRIHTYPMKGTIDASIENAESKILSNEKEMAEHVMVVDLLRNDLGIVANDIRVERFRYIDRIRAGEKELLQVSSKISGKLPENWRSNIGSILEALLPAGSISGTPKKRTVEIIQEIEGYERDYFTGVFGYFDGKNLYSAVMIRFLENIDGELVYKSGGGITIDSDPKEEYDEMLAKIYIP